MKAAGRFPIDEGGMPPPSFELPARVGKRCCGTPRKGTSRLVGAR